MTARLDRELLARGLVTSRTRAVELIRAGKVQLNGRQIQKPSAAVEPGADITVTDHQHWVSRAAHKLLGALQVFPAVDPEGRRCLDAGASTGGFTQVLLERGAHHVVAADVGHHQLAAPLRNHRQVSSHEGINLRYVQPGEIGDPFDLIVADLSFISLTLVIEPLSRLAAAEADLLLMVKPQFEVGRDLLPRTGVVSSPAQRRAAVEDVIAAASQSGLIARGLARSALAGQDGNAEFFLHLRPAAPAGSATGDRVGEADLHAVDGELLDHIDWH